MKIYHSTMKKGFYGALWALGVLLLNIPSAQAYFDVNKPKPTATNTGNSGGRTGNFGCSAPSSRATLDINNIRALILNGGDNWWDLVGAARYEFPKTTDPGAVTRSVLFCGGIWIGGVDPDNPNTLFVLAQTYRQSQQMTYWPGPLDSLSAATTRQRCSEWNSHFKCERTTVQQFYSDYERGLIRSESDIPEQIRFWPGRNNPYLRRRPGAPINDLNYDLARFVDIDGDGNYNPLRGDYPRLPGGERAGLSGILSSSDQCFFAISNDRGGEKLIRQGQPTNAIGMEVHTESFAYATSDPRNDMTFYRNKLINKGQVTLDRTYFGQWVDPDLGSAYDDFVGCDVERGLGICYNGADFDPGISGYGFCPPAVAVDFFIGPRADANDGIDNNKNGVIDEADEKIIMSNFLYYNNDGNQKNGNPESANDYYNYLRNIWKDGNEVSYDLRNGTTPVSANVPFAKFMFPDDSDQKICWGSGGTTSRPCPTGRLPIWNERSAGNQPGDRRFLSSAGPFRLQPGMINQLTIGVVVAQSCGGGPTASFAKMEVADDLAQQLFDRNFQILLGPNEPKVEITEFDGELIMTIIADSFAGQTTETYTIEDPNLNKLNGDPNYRFEGYIVYQLKDATVGTSDLDDPAKAQIVLQSDLRNGVSTIFNQEFDPVADELVRRKKVTGSDKGLVNTIRINRDLFVSGSAEGLVNFKKYYYRVVAYAYNGHPENREPFLIGTPRIDPKSGRIIDRIEAVPHKTNPEKSGTILNTRYGDGFDITRLSGAGNGGIFIGSPDITSEREILRNGSTSNIKFNKGEAPIDIKVYNPKRVTPGDFELELSSRVRYNKNRSSYQFVPGDTIVCDYSVNSIGRTITVRDAAGTRLGDRTFALETSIRQSAGIAIVNRAVPLNDSLTDLDVQVLNDHEGGTFVAIVSETFQGTNPNASPVFERYSTASLDFFKKGNTNQRANCRFFDRHDFWKLTEKRTNRIIYNARPISTEAEQVVPEYGISITVKDTTNPGEFNERNLNVGFIGGSVNMETLEGVRQATSLWLVPVPNIPGTPTGLPFRHLVDDRVIGSTAIYNYYTNVDPNLRMLNFLLDNERSNFPVRAPGGIAPFSAALTTGELGGRRPNVFPQDQLTRTNFRTLRNVDVVLTEDRSKWTKCIVLNAYRSNAAVDQMIKSKVTSIDRNFRKTNALSPYVVNGVADSSRGISWFPGYAIDVDRGIRLNMAFAEDDQAPIGNGNDLVYEYSDVTQQGFFTSRRHFGYVLTSPYGTGEGVNTLERQLDSIANIRLTGTRGTAYSNFFASQFMYVLNLAAAIGAPRDRSNARISARVCRAFESFPSGPGINQPPRYSFSTDSYVPKPYTASEGTSALDLIRVVPNPYYAFSPYELAQNGSLVKITNLPTKCKISIMNLSGTIVWQQQLDRTGTAGVNETTWLDWDMKNMEGIPVASGAYLIHIDAGHLGQKVVKWFGVMRPIDMDGTNQN